MSILVEIAGRADVSVEGVVRVLTREPVSAAVKERVLVVLDQLDADQTRVLERFALASIHDVVTADDGSVEGTSDASDQPEQPPVDHAGVVESNGNRPHEHSPLPAEGAATAEPVVESDAPGEGGAVAPSDQTDLTGRVGLLIEELVAATTEIRRESRVDRQERLDDLALLVELISTGWQGVDRRLARIERVVERLATAPQRLPAPVRSEPVPVVAVPPVPESAPPIEAVPIEVAPIEAAPIEAAPIEVGPERKRGWPPFATTLLFLATLVVALVALDLIPSRAETPSFAPVSDETPTQPRASSTTAPGAPTEEPRATTTPETTATETTATETTPKTQTTARVAPTATTPQPTTSAQRPRQTSTAPAPRAAPPTGTSSSSGFKPARTFVWPAIEGVGFYSVRFFRAGKALYGARVSEPRITIPKRIVFKPGAYRWVVRPETGSGPNRLGAPIIDSAFSVAKP